MKQTDKCSNIMRIKNHGGDELKSFYRPAFAIDSLISFSTQIVIFGLAFISSILISRLLGPEGKGIYSFVFLVPIMTKTIITMGINSSNVYFIGGEKFPENRIIGNAFFYSICIGGGVAIILIILVPFINKYFLHNISNVYFYLTISTIPILLLIENIYYVLLAKRKMIELSWFRLVQPVIYIIALLFFINRASLSIIDAIIANILGILSTIFLGSYFFLKNKYLTGLITDINIFKEMINFGVKQHLGTVSQLLNYRIDMFIIAAMLTPADLGLYSISVLIAETIWYLPNSIGQVLFAKTASEKIEDADYFTPLVCRSVIFVSFFACTVLFLISDFIIPLLFTSMFLSSVMALKLLLPGIFFFSISKILAQDLVGRGFPQYASVAATISLVAIIMFDLSLIPRFGINGASVASTISYFLSAIIILYMFKKKSQVKLWDILIIKANDLEEYKRIISYFIAMLKAKKNN